MPFNYLACSIKGTAFSEYSSLLLITREMNSLPGGFSLPNANPLPKHTLHLRPPSNPLPGPRAQLSSAHCGCLRTPREPPEPSGEHQRHRAGSCPALAPSRPRTVDMARHPPTSLRPEPHPTASELPPLAALSAPVTQPEVGVKKSVLEKRTGVCKSYYPLALGWS